MRSFQGKLAIITGGGSGMGRELVLQLAAEGCSVATCDINRSSVEETVAIAQPRSRDGARITGHVCDVADEKQVLRFRDEAVDQHAADHVELLINNAGIAGDGSFITGSRERWERTFAVDWWGVYYSCRAFVPLLISSEEAVLVNVSSVAGFWASLGPGMPLTAYSAAKFAVKGFTEALIDDFRANAPHVKVAVVMPGLVGTNFFRNSRRAHGEPDPEDMSDADIERAITWLADLGLWLKDTAEYPARRLINELNDRYRETAPLSAAGAATIILDGLREGKWRILVGGDAEELDVFVRTYPDDMYDYAKHTGMAVTLRYPQAL